MGNYIPIHLNDILLEERRQCNGQFAMVAVNLFSHAFIFTMISHYATKYLKVLMSDLQDHSEGEIRQILISGLSFDLIKSRKLHYKS